jgi:hypothetical protein
MHLPELLSIKALAACVKARNDLSLLRRAIVSDCGRLFAIPNKVN